MKRIVEMLSGKKTYLIAAVAAVAWYGQAVGWWEVPEFLWAMLGFGGAAAMRAGVAKSGK